jgi:dipeptidase E
LSSYFSGAANLFREFIGDACLGKKVVFIPTASLAQKVTFYVGVEGGNTFFLLQELKRSGADKLIVEHINRGKIYIGASAGSMIVSKDIEYAKYMDDPAVAEDLNNDFSALSIVDFYIVPHYANFPFKKAAEK